MEEKKHKIAIVLFKTSYDYGDYDDFKTTVANSITEWAEVDEKTYKELWDAHGRVRLPNNMAAMIVEQPENQADFVIKTVEDYRTFLKKEKERLEKLKRDAEKKKREKVKNRKAKEIEKRKAIYEELKAEFDSGPKA